jgi:hypothetical protein
MRNVLGVEGEDELVEAVRCELLLFLRRARCCELCKLRLQRGPQPLTQLRVAPSLLTCASMIRARASLHKGEGPKRRADCRIDVARAAEDVRPATLHKRQQALRSWIVGADHEDPCPEAHPAQATTLVVWDFQPPDGEQRAVLSILQSHFTPQRACGQQQHTNV